MLSAGSRRVRIGSVELTVVAGFAVAVLVLSLAPGPDMMFIVANAVAGGRRARNGRSRGHVYRLGGALSCRGIRAGSGDPGRPAVLDGVRIVGAVLLVSLAVGTWRESREQPTQATAGVALLRRSLRKVYAMATLTNLANPKIQLFYLAFLPQFLTIGPTNWSVTAQLLVLGALIIVVGLLVDASAGVLAGTLSDRLLHHGAIRRWLDRTAAAIFGGLAARLALDIR